MVVGNTCWVHYLFSGYLKEELEILGEQCLYGGKNPARGRGVKM